MERNHPLRKAYIAAPYTRGKKYGNFQTWSTEIPQSLFLIIHKGFKRT
jgi:hypothetical protein